MRPWGRAGLAHGAEVALVVLDVTGLCPGSGPSSQALTLGVTRPVHLTQQKRTGRPSGSGSSLGQPLVSYSLPGPHSRGSLFCTDCAAGGAGREVRGVESALASLHVFSGSALLFQADRGFQHGSISPVLTYLSPWTLPCLPPWSWVTELT